MKKRTDIFVSILLFQYGGVKEIRTLAGELPRCWFSRPVPSTTWVLLRVPIKEKRD